MKLKNGEKLDISTAFPHGVDWRKQLSVAQSPAAYPAAAASAISDKEARQAYAEVSSWPEYEPTALRRLSKLEKHLGCGAIYYKDESTRFGLGSFKALGGAYAVLKHVAAEYHRQHAETVALSDIRQGKIKDFAAAITVATATDGNHGRSVAWGARNAGCPCRIYIHAEVSRGREKAMSALGAEVIRIDGDYDESVKLCAAEASKNAWQMVSDTSYEGYTEIPSNVMAGYTVLATEVIGQMDEPPTHVFLQAGVGGLAGAISARLWMEYGSKRPHITVVESDYSACVLQSFRQRAPATVEITEETVMAGLSCGEMSLLAWQILEGCCDQVMTLADDQVATAMKLFADGEMSDQPIEAGECAVPGVLALMASVKAAQQNYSNARILVLGCEGATDAAVYKSMLESVS